MNGELVGADKLCNALRSVEKSVANKQMRKALRVGAKVIQAQEIADAPKRTGATAAAIKVRAGKRKRGFISMAVVLSKQLFAGAFYPAFVNYGRKTRPHSLESVVSGDSGKKVEGTRWANEAFQKSAKPALDAITKSITEGLKEEAAAASGGE
jgi:HK97 gp10 family phage protein